MSESEGGQSALESAGPDPESGDGGEISRSDLVMLTTAVNRGWNVPDATRARLMSRLHAMVDNPATSTRTLLSVARVLHALNGQDLEAEKPAAPAHQHLHIAAPIPASPDDQRVFAEAARRLRNSSNDSQSHAQ